jgi:hypothetical protein
MNESCSSAKARISDRSPPVIFRNAGCLRRSTSRCEVSKLQIIATWGMHERSYLSDINMGVLAAFTLARLCPFGILATTSSDTRFQRTNAGARRPAPGRPPGWLTRASSAAGGLGVTSHRPPRGLPPGTPGASMASSAIVSRGCCPRSTGWSGCARPTGCHPIPTYTIRDRCGEAGGGAPDQESGSAAAQPAGRSPRTRSALSYINWYINGYGRP